MKALSHNRVDSVARRVWFCSGTDGNEYCQMCIRDRHISCITRACCKRADDRGVTVETPEGERFLEADTIVVALGTRALQDEAEAFRDCAPTFWLAGDCAEGPKNVRHAIRNGYDAACRL